MQKAFAGPSRSDKFGVILKILKLREISKITSQYLETLNNYSERLSQLGQVILFGDPLMVLNPGTQLTEKINI